MAMLTLKNTHRKTPVTLTLPLRSFAKEQLLQRSFVKEQPFKEVWYTISAHTETADKKFLRHLVKYSSRETVPLNKARAVPAHRQRRLFDETREAEKVVQFLAGLSPGDMAQLLLPTLLQAAHARCACGA
jgi:hypothetical protein